MKISKCKPLVSILIASLMLLALHTGLKAQTAPTTDKQGVGQQNQADLSSKRSQLTEAEFKEFQNWVALGPGGLPHRLEGFRTLQRLNKKLRDPLDISLLASKMGTTGDVRTLRNLPKRSGTRPVIAPFAIPHRQTDQHNAVSIREKQKAVFMEVVDQNKALVHFQKSYFEKHHKAVFLNDSTQGNQTIVRATHGEVGHMHPTDGSMHFSLSPSDTKEVLEKGWGELHGLAGQVYKGSDALPATYLMVYSPRTEQELAVVRKILQAAIRYSSLRANAPAGTK